MISRASLDDAARASVLLNASVDDHLITVSGIRYRFESARLEDRMQYWRAECEGELVGWAYGGLDAFAAERTTGFAGIVVHPSHRREGIGPALWDVVSAHLDEIGARRIVAYSRTAVQTRTRSRLPVSADLASRRAIRALLSIRGRSVIRHCHPTASSSVR